MRAHYSSGSAHPSTSIRSLSSIACCIASPTSGETLKRSKISGGVPGGIAEVLGAIGLIVPMVTGIVPGLTIAAAAGLVLVQICAIVFHLSRGEGKAVPANVVLLLLALLVVIGRVAIAPIG